MKLEPFRLDDIAPFLKLAATEHWVVEPWEFEFLLSAFSRGCFTARRDTGETTGFVTSLRHDRSGWIGNLIVSSEYRGEGIGESLFAAAFEALRSEGVETFWLTASKSGERLYKKYGFNGIDSIVRWVGTGRRRSPVYDLQREAHNSGGSVSGIDRQAWGDRRDSLLAETAGRGVLLLQESGFIVIQPSGSARQFGPFSALDSGSAERLFYDAAKSVAPGGRMLVDSPASNQSACRLFTESGMKISGSNSLMFAGKKPEYRPDLVYGLATMGSCG